MKEILLIGGGGHCKSCIDVIEQQGIYKIGGIIDLKENFGKKVLGYPIIGCDDDLPKFMKDFNIILITIGQIYSPESRVKAFHMVQKQGWELPVIISPHAYVSKHTTIGAGTIVMHGAQINASVSIGVNCIVNSNALIEHDSNIGDHCHISTGSVVNGGCRIGNRSFFGSGAISKQYSIIPEDSFIKANSIVK